MLLDPDGPDIPDTFTGDTIDAGAVVSEHVALAIDPYPRKAGRRASASGSKAPTRTTKRPNPVCSSERLEKGLNSGRAAADNSVVTGGEKRYFDRNSAAGSPLRHDAKHLQRQNNCRFHRHASRRNGTGCGRKKRNKTRVVRISLDVMGGDFGPQVVIPGAAKALERHPRHKVRSSSAMRPQCRPLIDKVSEAQGDQHLPRCEIAVAMDDKPSQALRRGRGKSSMWRAIDAINAGEADVAVSAGNTGALMAMSAFCLRTMAGHRAPARSPASGRPCKGESIVLDVGATIGADAQPADGLRPDGRRHGARAVRHRAPDRSACSMSASRKSRARKRSRRPAG